MLAAACLLSGCVSMAEGTVEPSREILLTSTPSGAKVRQAARQVCSTPCTVRQSDLAYGKPFDFEFPDGQVLVVDPRMKTSGNILGNVIFGGIGGAIIDAATGRLVVNARHVHAEAKPRL